jgi:hypothetical protein
MVIDQRLGVFIIHELFKVVHYLIFELLKLLNLLVYLVESRLSFSRRQWDDRVHLLFLLELLTCGIHFLRELMGLLFHFVVLLLLVREYYPVRYDTRLRVIQIIL